MWTSHTRWAALWTFRLKCHTVCLSVILLCYRITRLWFCKKDFYVIKRGIICARLCVLCFVYVRFFLLWFSFLIIQNVQMTLNNRLLFCSYSFYFSHLLGPWDKGFTWPIISAAHVFLKWSEITQYSYDSTNTAVKNYVREFQIYCEGEKTSNNSIYDINLF